MKKHFKLNLVLFSIFYVIFASFVITNSINNELIVLDYTFSTTQTLINFAIFVIFMTVIQTVSSFADEKMDIKIKKLTEDSNRAKKEQSEKIDNLKMAQYASNNM